MKMWSGYTIPFTRFQFPMLTVSNVGLDAPLFASGLHKSPHFKAIWRSTENREPKSGTSLLEFGKVVLVCIRVHFLYGICHKIGKNIYVKGEENPETRQQSCSNQCSRESHPQAEIADWTWWGLRYRQNYFPLQTHICIRCQSQDIKRRELHR